MVTVGPRTAENTAVTDLQTTQAAVPFAELAAAGHACVERLHDEAMQLIAELVEHWDESEPAPVEPADEAAPEDDAVQDDVVQDDVVQDDAVQDDAVQDDAVQDDAPTDETATPDLEAQDDEPADDAVAHDAVAHDAVAHDAVAHDAAAHEDGAQEDCAQDGADEEAPEEIRVLLPSELPALPPLPAHRDAVRLATAVTDEFARTVTEDAGLTVAA
ncbi:hypothetical protein A7K94_0211805 [Modestobacter sp. VKM Ac-2676]|nr:hypothetical protein A7K94_0211805 [Modestobacter sp. VKM Ac-2676]